MKIRRESADALPEKQGVCGIQVQGSYVDETSCQYREKQLDSKLKALTADRDLQRNRRLP